MNIMDHNIPEMVVFIQEDNDESIKDISVDKGMSQEGKCILEDCEFHHNIIPSLFEPDLNRSSGSNLQTMEIDSREEVSTNYARNEISSQTHREFLGKELEISRSIKNWQLNSSVGSIDSTVEFAQCDDYLQVTDGTNMSISKMENPQNLTSSGTRQVDYPENTSSCVICPIAASTSSRASHQSDDSTSSTHSFAFPT
ncbi:unnamed protein product [Lupinus luteus]|uniref:Uncharacterized protein n=1 Tax=Lupinus luteus TaxID=3873 RepID=A0AAV1W6W0_LUPLU